MYAIVFRVCLPLPRQKIKLVIQFGGQRSEGKLISFNYEDKYLDRRLNGSELPMNCPV